MVETTQIITNRLLLKGVTPSVVSKLFENHSSQQVKDFFQFDDTELSKLKLQNEQGMETFRLSLYYFLLIEKTTEKIIGECGFHTWNATHHRADLFYSLRNEDFKKQGYMTEALEKVLSFGFESLDLHRVQALVAYDNIPSLKLLAKYGFKKEGTAREDYLVDGKFEDSECYALLKQEWKTER